jgi:hypothetical protein
MPRHLRPVVRAKNGLKTIQINLGITEVAELPGNFVQIHGATKIRILFFFQLTARYSLAEENRPSAKLHSTHNVSRKRS